MCYTKMQAEGKGLVGELKTVCLGHREKTEERRERGRLAGVGVGGRDQSVRKPQK